MTIRLASLRPLLLSCSLLVLAACPKDKAPADTVAQIPVDTMPQDLSQLQTNIPEAAPDTFKQLSAEELRKAQGVNDRPSAAAIPQAPPALMAAVERDISFQRFCYQERGLKSDPALSGGVAMQVTVGSAGVTDTKVANSRWSSNAGREVNTCLADKARQAWKLEAGAVKPGRYIVPLSFRGA